MAIKIIHPTSLTLQPGSIITVNKSIEESLLVRGVAKKVIKVKKKQEPVKKTRGKRKEGKKETEEVTQ